MLTWIYASCIPKPSRMTSADRRFFSLLGKRPIGFHPGGWPFDVDPPADGHTAVVPDGRIFLEYTDSRSTGYVWIDPRKPRRIHLKPASAPTMADDYERITFWEGGGLSVQASSDGWETRADVYFVDRKEPLYSQDVLIFGDVEYTIWDLPCKFFWADPRSAEENHTLFEARF